MHVCYMDYHIKVGFFNINTHLTRLGCAFKLKRAKYKEYDPNSVL